MAPERFSDRIIKHIAGQGYRPGKVHQLARAMGIAEDEYGDFRKAVKALMRTGRIVLGSASALTLPQPGRTVVGRFRANPRGFGFVIPDEPNAHGDLFVPQGHSAGAVTGDTVVARVLKRGKRGGKMIHQGRIIEIVSRGQSRFVGELCRELNRWFVHPDGKTLHAPILVGDPGAKSARPGDQVVVEIVEYPTQHSDAHGVIVRVLGKRGDPGVETRSIICQYQLPEEFPEPVDRRAAEVIAAHDPKQAAAAREDLRDLTVITIDPEDARDFDDAISLTQADNGQVVLGVHIADVSHFVRPGDALDVEARDRASSIYFPRQVIPMLPEVLSNGLCSLQERRLRLAKSVFITYSRKGQRLATRLANTVIRSAKRLSYQQASRILVGKTGRFSPKVVDLLQSMEALARAIQQRRVSNGMLSLDLPEPKIILDDQGRVTGVEPSDTSYSHTIIEMFMVEANEAVAELLAGLGWPNLRRIHPPPDDAAAQSLTRFLQALGMPALKKMDRQALQRIISQVKGKPESFAVNIAVLRSMQPAEYRPGPEEHFALASQDYVHFTSPIRRYPDLTIHRLLEGYLQGQGKKRRRPRDLPTVEDLEELGTHCTNNERRAEAAERELRMVHILGLLAAGIGQEYDGIVTGVTNFGVFVQLADYFIDGLLRFDDLPDDWWELDADTGCVIGQRTGMRLRIGDRLRVITARIDIADRELDLALAEGPKRPARKAAKGPTPKRTRRPRVPRRQPAANKTARRRKR